MIFAAGGGYPWFAFDLPFWSTVVFVLLVGLLAATALKPLVQGMNARQAAIENNLHQAQVALAEIAELRRKHDAERQEARRRAEAVMEEARQEASLIKGRVLARAATEANAIAARAQRDISLLRQKAIHELWGSTTELATSAAERLLRTQLTAEDHRRVVADAGQAILTSMQEAA